MSNKETLQQIDVDKDGRIAELEACIAQLQRENERLSQQIRVLLNRMYRRKSERIDPRQLLLFDLASDRGAAEGAEVQEEDEPKRPGDPAGQAATRGARVLNQLIPSCH